MAKFNIYLSDKILAAAPGLRVMAVEADIINSPTTDTLWQAIKDESAKIAATLRLEDVNKLPGIRPTRIAYKACGKEPNRYRPSAEALTRRMVKGMDLYRTLQAIDLINLISVRTGHSIGGFDADKIDGTRLTLGIGEEGEPFEAIGRGTLNICGLPVYRDSLAAIGTPTSDCERTKLTPDTTHLLMLVNIYDTDSDTDSLLSLLSEVMTEHGFKITDVNLISGAK